MIAVRGGAAGSLRLLVERPATTTLVRRAHDSSSATSDVEYFPMPTADEDGSDGDGEADWRQLLGGKRGCAEEEPAQLTLRACLVGLAVGTLLCFTNMYFGLQTGWVTMGSIQSALCGFAFFRFVWPAQRRPFGPLENVVVQTLAVATATMPLAGGFVGIIPALSLLDPPVVLTWWQQLLWCAWRAHLSPALAPFVVLTRPTLPSLAGARRSPTLASSSPSRCVGRSSSSSNCPSPLAPPPPS